MILIACFRCRTSLFSRNLLSLYFKSIVDFRSKLFSKLFAGITLPIFGEVKHTLSMIPELLILT